MIIISTHLSESPAALVFLMLNICSGVELDW